MEYTLCIRCATVYKPSEDGLIRCPKCQYTVSQELYDKLMHYSRSASEFGYTYRLVFEQDYEEDGTCSNRYSLSFDEIITFCAVAALSGIIGNVAYDVIKAAINKIIVQLKAKGEREEVKALENIFKDSHKFEVFVQYLTDYYNGLPDLNPEVKIAILDEISTHAKVDILGSKMTEIMDWDSVSDDTDEELERKIEEIEKAEVEASESIHERIGSYIDPPESSDFDGFWQGFE